MMRCVPFLAGGLLLGGLGAAVVLDPSGVADRATYYEVVQDLRECASPMCGGYFVRAVNAKEETVCYGGSAAAECYAAALNLPEDVSPEEAQMFFESLGGNNNLDDADAFGVHVLATLAGGTGHTEGYGVLEVERAWAPGFGVKSTSVAAVVDSGIACLCPPGVLSCPCPRFAVDMVNARKTTTADELTFNKCLDDTIAEAARAAVASTGILAATLRVERRRNAETIITGVAFPLGAWRGVIMCGGSTAEPMPPCDGGFFCSYATADFCGRADVPGRCEQAPIQCGEVDAPVCGCDGLTYLNKCEANAASTSVDYVGECRREDEDVSCGGRTTEPAPPCDDGFFCRYTTAAVCGRTDAPGQCEYVPDLCTAIYAPVCGCDGLTYSSECAANAASTSVDYVGECRRT